MQEVITYSLKTEQPDSEQYYKDVAGFTDEVLEVSEELTGHMVESFRSFIAESGYEAVRSSREYLLELLTLGVLWKIYSGDALELQEKSRMLLTGLVSLRQQGGQLKPGIDFLRGILSTVFLSPDLYDHPELLEPTPAHLEKLLNWLEATGEFTQEARRLQHWKEYLYTCQANEAADYLATAITLAAWFEARSEEVLGKYTANVESYLDKVRPKRYWKEDVIFCGRRRVEYHLNMVGAEIMNRAFYADFHKCRHKAVVLPACMCALPRELCKAKETSKGYVCSGCTEYCKVFQLTHMAGNQGVSIFIIPHESDAFADRKSTKQSNDDLGIIGIACALNLLSGGWKAKDLGLQPQCVLLDYCGCRNHWHPEGLVTDINMNELNRKIQVYKLK